MRRPEGAYTFEALLIEEEARLRFERAYAHLLGEREQEKRARDATLQSIELASFRLD